jgi:hypothetical protein
MLDATVTFSPTQIERLNRVIARATEYLGKSAADATSWAAVHIARSMRAATAKGTQKTREARPDPRARGSWIIPIYRQGQPVLFKRTADKHDPLRKIRNYRLTSKVYNVLAAKAAALKGNSGFVEASPDGIVSRQGRPLAAYQFINSESVKLARLTARLSYPETKWPGLIPRALQSASHGMERQIDDALGVIH